METDNFILHNILFYLTNYKYNNASSVTNSIIKIFIKGFFEYYMIY